MGGFHLLKPSLCSIEKKLALVNIFHLRIYLAGFSVFISH